MAEYSRSSPTHPILSDSMAGFGTIMSARPGRSTSRWARAPATAQMFSAFADTDAPVLVAHNQPGVAAVEVRTLDSCLDEWKLDRVDFLKLDVDGSETAVLAGASDTLAAHKIRAILCEFSLEWLDRVGSSAEALWATLVNAGFEPVWPSSKMPSSSLFNQFLVCDF